MSEQLPQHESQVEPDEVNIPLLSIVGTFGAVVVLLIILLLQAWFYNLRGTITSERTLSSGSPETSLGRTILEQQQQIGSYHWINREAGVRAIPIGRAMEVLAAEMAADHPTAVKTDEKEKGQ